MAGSSAVGEIEGFDASSLRTSIGAEIRDLEPKEIVDKQQRRSLRKMTRNDVLALVGSILAVRDSGLELTDDPEGRNALFVGSNKEICSPNHLLEPAVAARRDDGQVDIRRFGEVAQSEVYPLFFLEGLQAAPLFYVSEAFGLRGPNTFFAGGAEAGMTAVGRAFRAIKRGEADVAIAGGYDDAVSWWSMCKFDAFGVMSPSNELGAGACRPYDENRDGTVLGEGAALLVLEELDAAKARGARIYAELKGFGTGEDTHGLISPDPEGRGLRLAIQRSMDEAGLAPSAIDYVAAHGSGTEKGDVGEARALSSVLEDGAAVSSVKPATGHLIGGAGPLNVAIAALAVHDGAVPPNLNLEQPDPACDGLELVREARELPVQNALAVARGFEGQNVILAVGTAD
jgi:3-oxoacyl-[acyl-carrier-protein] synthase II